MFQVLLLCNGQRDGDLEGVMNMFYPRIALSNAWIMSFGNTPDPPAPSCYVQR
jgi:hypothetical protein